MEITTTDRVKEELLSQDAEFRELAKEHGRYEERLSELSSLAYPSDEEQLEEITLKKKKLAIRIKCIQGCCSTSKVRFPVTENQRALPGSGDATHGRTRSRSTFKRRSFKNA